MATETTAGPSGGAVKEDTTKQEETKQEVSQTNPSQPPAVGPVIPAASEAAPPPATAAPAAEKQLSNAQKKILQKAEKAARRAQAKALAPPPPAPPPPSTPSKTDPSPGGVGGGGDQAQRKARTTSMHQGQKPVFVVPPPKEKKASIPECFSHLPMARRIPLSQADKDVHPAVLAVGQQMAAFALTDSIGWLEGKLFALKKEIDSYTTPPGSSFSRHFTPHALNPQIDYLSACRPMCFCMGSAVRWLKLKISTIDTDADDAEAKSFLWDEIDEFLMARIALADASVVANAADHIIEEGDCIVTFGSHRLVESTFRRAREQGKNFSVVVLDDPIDRSGRALAEALSSAEEEDGVGVGIRTRYSPTLGGIEFALSNKATKVMLGAESMFSNGAMYGRAGSADVALCAASYGIPVIALCHSFNFTERAATDSLTYNEIDPDRHSDGDFRLLFDTTTNVTIVVTDVGSAPPRSATCVLRRWEDI